MAIFNLGSVNIDHFYKLAHFPEPGETLSALDHTLGLGGKGMNQSVAAAKAGAEVFHIGAIGKSDGWVRERIESYGVNCKYLREVDEETGHAVIYVDAAGENTIVLAPGANVKQDSEFVVNAIDQAKSTDTLLLQNETNLQPPAATFALVKGMRVIYSAAPFSIEAVKNIIPDLSMLVMNAVEASQLSSGMGVSLDQIPVPQIMVTLGSKGAMWRSNETGEVIEVTSPKVTPVDTTAAGDTYIGYVAAGLDLGMPIKAAMEWATQAAALKVTRAGTADAIPSADEVKAFRGA
ncbi:ribokinase [Celeribacter halophilus]|uniref:ribokinase n=1 Tax=Celeribacter halophilus TaxID=576117 RepID=UPI001C084031|nr:ribokinase [Celeribacter halophilus]MBU2889686.1 ribokinase [Celeribacter halophilus]MDO6510671.1 ribokinase [Celeribacter halophilus]